MAPRKKPKRTAELVPAPAAVVLDVPSMADLTPREATCVISAAAGNTAKEIAANLGLEVGHVRAIFSRPQVRQTIAEINQASVAMLLARRADLAERAIGVVADLMLPINPPGVRAKGVDLALRMGVFGEAGAKGGDVNVNVQIDARTQTAHQISVTPEQLERLGPDELDALIARLKAPLPAEPAS